MAASIKSWRRRNTVWMALTRCLRMVTTSQVFLVSFLSAGTMLSSCSAAIRAPRRFPSGVLNVRTLTESMTVLSSPSDRAVRSRSLIFSICATRSWS